MPKKKPESCLFCGEWPCACNAKPKKKAAPRKRPERVSEPPVASVVSDLDFATVETKSRFQVEAKTDEIDLVFINALRCLREIVSDRDKRWIDTQLKHSYPQSLDRRIAEWKAKHSQ